MMGRQEREQGRLFYEFRLEDRIPENHLLRRMNVFVTVALADLHKELEPHYSKIGRPSIDPELMMRMLIVGYCYGIRSERKLCQEVELHLAYRWFCKLDLDDKVPHHSTFSENRLGRFRESDLLRHIFERVVWATMAMGLVKGEVSMPACWKPTPVATTACRPTRSTGLTRKSKSARSRSISMHSMLKPRNKRTPKATAARTGAELSVSPHSARRRR